jgi:hypothetical protein
MIRVVVFAEGQTEEQFIKQTVAPVFAPAMIFLEPRLLKTSQNAKGGAVSFDRLKFYATNTLKENNAPVLSTFLDLYALDTDFPGYAESKNITDIYQKVDYLESALNTAIVQQVGCHPDRFLPHIQPYEFEGLLFSDISALCETEQGWQSSRVDLQRILDGCGNPECINDGYETKPSKRLENALSPKYHKTRHGPLAAQRITLGVIEKQCHHFHEWLEKLRSLALSSGTGKILLASEG